MMGSGLAIVREATPDANGLIRGTYQNAVSTRTTNDPPRLVDIESAFGFATEVGVGFTGILDIGGAGTSYYFCASDGMNWFYAAMTKAVTD